MTLDDVPREWLVAAVALLLVLFAWSWLVGALRRRRLRRRFDHAAAGEREAAAILEAQGYVIEGAQVCGGYTLQVDGQPIEVEVRADYIAARGSRRYVAEVKTGAVATKVTTIATRRQLLEYAHAFEVDGILLVDAEARRIHHVVLPFPARRASGFFERLLG